MVVSRQMGQEIVDTIMGWAEDNEVSLRQLIRLARLLSNVPGNRSYQETTEMLVKLLESEEEG